MRELDPEVLAALAPVAQVPALIVHCVDDVIVAPDQGRRLAAAWRVGVAMGVLALAAFATQCYLQVRSYYPPSGQRLAPFAQGYMAVQPRPWLFGDWLDFAEVANTPVTDTNAAHMLALSERVVQWRPVPAVIEPLLRSAVLAQRPDLALAYLERYKAAYPGEYAEWAKLNQKN